MSDPRVRPPFWFEPEPNRPGEGRLGVDEDWVEALGGDPVCIELAAAGTRLQHGDTFGFVHTGGGLTFDLRAPAALEVLTPNAEVEAEPRLLAIAPYGRGMLAHVRLL